MMRCPTPATVEEGGGVEDVCADDPRQRERVDHDHHEAEVGAAPDRGEADDEAEHGAGGEGDQLVAAAHDEGRLARLHPAFHERLGEEADAAADERDADRIAENRLRARDRVLELVRGHDAGNRQRARTHEQPEREVAVNRAETAMPDCAERFEDRTVDDVRADGSRRLEAEEDDEDRRHQRAATHAGQADDHSEPKPGQRELPGHEALRTMPAPTVSFVASSISTNAPVVRFSS